MIGDIFPKPIQDQSAFRAAMAWCCNPANNAVMAEYLERYEVIEKPAPPDPVDVKKSQMLDELNTAWLNAEATGKVTVDDIEIDATSRSNRDIEGLIISMEAQGIETTTFCAADNSFQEFTSQQLYDFQLAVNGLGQRLYARKWGLRTAIEAAETLEELAAIEISFDNV